MKYKIGDKVRVKPLSWFKQNCVREKDSDIEHGGYKNKEVKENFYQTDFINDKMLECCGDELTIKSRYNDAYTVCECDFYWDDWMFEDEEEKENKNMYIIIDKEDMGLVTKGLDFKDCFFNTLCEAEVEAQKYAKDMDISVDKLCVLSMADNTDVYEFTSELSHAYELGALKEK